MTGTGLSHGCFRKEKVEKGKAGLEDWMLLWMSWLLQLGNFLLQLVLLSAVAAAPLIITPPCEVATLILRPRCLLLQQSAVLPLRRFKDNMALQNHRIF